MSSRLPDDETVREAAPYWVRRSRSTASGGGPTLHLPDPDADRDAPEPLCQTTKRRGKWGECDVDCYPPGYGSVCKLCKQRFEPVNTSMTNVIERSCAICGDDMIITLAEDGEILDGGYYWDSLLEGAETDADSDKDGEYWECEDCYEDVEAELNGYIADMLAQQAADADGDWTALDDLESE